MKNIYIISIASLIALLSGCSKHSVEDCPEFIPNSYIFFDTDITGTKGTLISGTLPGNEGTAFGVFGFRPTGSSIFGRYKTTAQGDKIESSFDNVAKVYRPTGSTNADSKPFTYDGLAGWVPGNHAFYAYYPYESTPSIISSVDSDTDGYYIDYNQPTALNAMADVMTAATETIVESTDNGKVNLLFTHRLFAIDVVLHNNQTSSNREIIIKSATVEYLGIPNGGKLYFSGESEVNTAQISPIYSFASESASLTISQGEYILNGNESFFFLPCASLQMKVNMILLNAWNEEIPFTFDCTGSNALAPVGGFVAGHKYIFRISKNDKDITFAIEDATLPWDENDDIEIGFN